MDDFQKETAFTAPDPNDQPLESIQSILGDTRIIRFADGSAVVAPVQKEYEEKEQDPNQHDQNLAKVLPDNVLQSLGNTLKDAIEEDIESQEEYFGAVAKIIELLGIHIASSSSNEDVPFKGAATVYSMALFDSTLDLLASAISSLFPSTGMVDCVIQGEGTAELKDQAYRKKSFFNYFLTQVAKEYKKEAKRTILWSILAGSCYKKIYIDPVLGRPTAMFIRPEDFVVNRECTTHLTASRKTHILRMDGREFEIRKLSGLYKNIKIMSQDSYREDDSPIQDELDELSGYTETYYNKDDHYCIYECHVDYRIKEDIKAPDFDLALPYIISLDQKSGRILSIRRNWQKDDYLKVKQEYFVNYSLLPSLDGEGYGLVNYAGRLAEASTSILRQLINSGTYSNFPGGIYQAGIRLENNNLRPSPGEFVPIQTGGLPIQQAIQALPYKEPSAALKELLNNLEDNIKKPSAIINQKVMDMTPKAPMGSVLAMLESLQKVPNAILQGFHESFGQELMLLNARFAEWLPDNQPYPFKVPGGEHVIMKADFQDSIQVIPASDPSLQNSSYRFMQSEIILNNARQGPDLHNMRYAYEYFYKNMGLSPEEIQELLPAPKEENQTIPLDPITENQHLMLGKPVTAGITQDHAAHKLVHNLIMNDPNSSPETKAATTAHIHEHDALEFLVDMQARIGFEMPQDPSQIPPEMQNQIAISAAQVAQQKMQEQQAQNPPPLDPTQVMLEDSKLKAEVGMARVEVEKLKAQIEQQKVNMEYALAEQRQAHQRDIDAFESQLKQRKQDLDELIRKHELAIKQANETREHLQTINSNIGE